MDTPTSPTPLATVAEMWLFPVKSLAGQQVGAAAVERGGLAGDRTWAVRDAVTGAGLTARDAPDLRSVAARLDAPDAAVVLELPGGRDPVTGAQADAALSGVLGRAVRVVPAEASGHDVAAVHLVSRRAVAEVAEGAGCGACDVEDPRANLVLDLPPEADLETAWVGREVHLGEVVLRVTRTPKRCLGVYAEVVTPGTVEVGTTARLV